VDPSLAAVISLCRQREQGDLDLGSFAANVGYSEGHLRRRFSQAEQLREECSMSGLALTKDHSGATHISAVLAGLINVATPISTVVIAVFLLRQERLVPRVIGGQVIGLLGVMVVIGVWNGCGASQLLGIGAYFFAVICHGFGFSYARGHLSALPHSPVALATGQVMCETIQLLSFSLAFGHLHADRPTSSPVALGALDVLGTGVAYISNFHVVRRAPATIASGVTYLTLDCAVVVGIAFLGESVSWNEPLGALLIIAGAALTHHRRTRRSPRVNGNGRTDITR